LTLTTDGRGSVIIDFHARDTVPYVLLLLGLASLFTSVFFSSYVLAFIGLGLTFWGALFLYIKSTKYVKLELLNAASSSSLGNIERILVTTETDLKGIHLPPKNLVDYTSSLVFIPARPNQPLSIFGRNRSERTSFHEPFRALNNSPGARPVKTVRKNTQTTLHRNDHRRASRTTSANLPRTPDY
jgi:hypothetical protein